MGIAERREREKEQRRNDILDAAEKVFFENGYNNAKMDDVAEVAELSKGTLYLYFQNKEELYFGLTLRALTDLGRRFQNVLAGNANGLEKIINIGRAFHEFAKEEPEYYKTIAQYEIAQLETNESGKKMVDKCHLEGQKVLELVAAAIKQGIDDGSIRSDLDPMKTAFILQGLSNGLIQVIAREGEHMKKLEAFDPEDTIDDFINIMIRALRPDSN